MNTPQGTWETRKVTQAVTIPGPDGGLPVVFLEANTIAHVFTPDGESEYTFIQFNHIARMMPNSPSYVGNLVLSGPAEAVQQCTVCNLRAKGHGADKCTVCQVSLCPTYVT